MRHIQRSLGLALLLLASLMLGCSPPGPKRYEHWGTVTYQNKPIPAGMVYFDPDLAAPNDGPQGFAIIKDGTYDTRQRPDSGPSSGKYIIRVFAADGIEGPEAPVGKMLFSSEVRIPVELPTEASELNVVIPPETR